MGNAEEDDDDDEDDDGNGGQENSDTVLDRTKEPWLWHDNGKGDNGTGPFVGIIGDVQKKIDQNNLRFVKETLKPEHAGDYLYANNMRLIQLYKDFRDKYDIKEGDTDAHMKLRNKRMIVLVDRRHLPSSVYPSKDKSDNKDDEDVVTDHIWMYDAPPNCGQIPDDPVPEWHISASKTCLLPNMAYGEGKAAEMGNDYIPDDEKTKGDAQPSPQQQEKAKKRRDEAKSDPNVTTAANCMLYFLLWIICI